MNRNESNIAVDIIPMPRIGTYRDMMVWTRRPYATIARWAHKKEFQPGIYMGRGMFNFSQLTYWINKTGSFLREKKR
jgi:hypothetical protein